MMKTGSIILKKNGGPEVLEWVENTLPAPGDDEVLIDQKAIGVNFIDSYYRTGLYQTPFPTGLGTEASGVVAAVGSKVAHLKSGDRVAYAQGPLGSYAEKRIVPAKFVIKIPDSVSHEVAASVMLKGLTVRYLFKDIHPLKKDEVFLFHAAAGGVGLIACQWARHLGAKMIGTTSSDEKGEIAKSLGAWNIINYKNEDIPSKVLALTNGEKVSVVYDSVGKSTWEASINSLKLRGLLVSFGNASGPVTGINLSELQRGSFFVTRPILGHYVETQEKLQNASDDLFQLVSKGIIKSDFTTFKLQDAQEAHKHLAERDRVGGMVLIP